jgi:6-phosphofructokinase 2
MTPSRRILTLTVNPACDVSCHAEAVRAVRKVRTTDERWDPGGGGVNVSRVVREMGGETLALILSGGLPGAELERLIAAEGVPHRAIPIAGRTRIALTVHDRSARREYRFVPEGPEIAEAEWRTALAALEAEAAGWVVASGSLARLMPEDFYVRAAAIAARRGQRFVLDTSGAPLRAALGAGLTLIKASRGEFEALVGRPLPTPRAQAQAALDLVRQGAAERIAVSLGHQGALMAERGAEEVLWLRPPNVEAEGAVGAGDAMLGAMVWALARGESGREAFAWGVAAGAAAVMRPGTAQARREDVEALRRAIGPV